MPTPPFVLELREHVGHRELWLIGVTAYVLRPGERGPQVLLVRRVDDGRWTPVTGIVDPGEEPDLAAAREAHEETGVSIEVERLLAVRATGLVRYPNGDESRYLDHAFRCRYVSGDAHVADDESSEVGWFDVTDLPPLGEVFLAGLRRALAPDDGQVLFGDERRPR